ncbi:hypothetical protein BGK67_29505 [Streptomyces subrutilus]|uniref:Uncharacterized protein n=1 Tax=Streptomyces subrutilus TaxID=36818 RepID=A0A1E5Q2K4_9ACTN|nr:hypothetical protein BGK67_29505 [Streptomyces subrutilus]
MEEVTALVSLLKDTGRQPNPGHEALRTAAVTRPVHEVREMVALLGEPQHEVEAADITLRAAAVGRPIEDVALLVTILGTEESGRPATRSEVLDESGEGRAGPPGPPDPADEPYEEEPYEPPYRELSDAPHEKPRRRPEPAPEPARTEPARSGPPVLRHMLRGPVAIALLLTGAPHLPMDLAALSSAAPLDFLPLLVTVLCIGCGALLALRDTPLVWRAAAVTALGVVALHVFGGAAAVDPLAGAVGGSVTWAGSVVMLSAAAGAVLAGVALRNPRENAA